jgi:hypothetical protein
MPPMFFSREIDNPFWPSEFISRRDKHFPDLNRTRFGSIDIFAIIFWETLLKHQSNALTHYANGINGVYDRLDGRIK